MCGPGLSPGLDKPVITGYFQGIQGNLSIDCYDVCNLFQYTLVFLKNELKNTKIDEEDRK